MVAAIKTSAAHLPPPGLHALIKQRTGDLHRQLDSAPTLLALMHPGLDLPAYFATLRRFAAAYARIEPLLHALEPHKPAPLSVYRPRLPALLSDLAQLRVIDRLPELPALTLPSAADAATYYLGMRYVLEGATQGARLISARLEKNLPQLRDNCFSFWQLQRETAADWPSLCACLEQTKPAQSEDLLRAAEATFCIFIEAFSASEPST